MSTTENDFDLYIEARAELDRLKQAGSIELAPLLRIIDGIDKSRRAAWAKFYAEQDAHAETECRAAAEVVELQTHVATLNEQIDGPNGLWAKIKEQEHHLGICYDCGNRDYVYLDRIRQAVEDAALLLTRFADRNELPSARVLAYQDEYNDIDRSHVDAVVAWINELSRAVQLYEWQTYD